jgi:Ca-activated chloride channel family protein
MAALAMWPLCLVGILLAPGLLAQDRPIFYADSTLVTVPVLVTDARGIPIRDLQPNEFRLYDNGVPSEIRHISQEGELPLGIGIIVDISASQRAFLREHRITVDAFLTRLLRPGDRAFIVTVNEDVVLESEFIGRPSGPSQILGARGGEPLGVPCSTLSGRHLCGGTALWNAVYADAHLKLSLLTGAKALLILSDGNDTGSIHHLDQALEEVQRAEAVVYAIRYPDPLSRSAGDGLTRLAAETGGAELAPPAGDYSAAFDRIQRDLRSQYVLALRPETGGDPTHRLRVEVSRPGLSVRSRLQYFLPSAQ